ncbi:hypothetical protein ISN45_Aa03g026090 [Arabidopsis thaliana x Arabidopsis arenosa]|uniref:Uncharacterized protein n=1 Tax=Arabidopsis thaliana x Arabidopsis arenosa TaxID=1240361 RepID=A0A8T2AZB1_9BRAS|nr:hypothetical protein ISN45_Aa03g026090 [Arabidopsis thaliana x Arabidopsis arenosa]
MDVSTYSSKNSVDNHVSTREQITLQNTIDCVVYSTSLLVMAIDDTSQLGLELDEEVFRDKEAIEPGDKGVSERWFILLALEF